MIAAVIAITKKDSLLVQLSTCALPVEHTIINIQSSCRHAFRDPKSGQCSVPQKLKFNEDK